MMKRSRCQPNEQISVPENQVYVNDKFFKKMTFTWVGKKVLLDVFSQGKCGCCWACAGTAAITAIHAIKRKEMIPLSKQQLLNCQLVHYPNYNLELTLGKKACFASRPQSVYRFSIDHGIIEEARCPYKMQRNTCEPPPSDAKFVKIDAFNTLDLNETSMKDIEDCIRIQPITCSIRSYRSLHNHFGKVGKEIYMGPTEEEIAKEAETGIKSVHCMLIVGFGEENGEKFYLVQNSWGKKWGYKGFAKIKRSLLYNLSYPIINV